MAKKKCKYCGKTSCPEKDVFVVNNVKGCWSIFVSGTKALIFGSTTRKESTELAKKLEALVAEAFVR